MHDVAVEMTRRGFQVVVFTSNRGYADPGNEYADYEYLEGVHVVRLAWSSFGKSSIAARLVGGGLFLAQAVTCAATLPRIDHLLVSTSPPMGGIAGPILRRLRSVPFTFWSMDLNPDQIVASGRFEATSWPVRAFDWLMRETLLAAEHVVALDPFMAERLRRKEEIGSKLTILPPWPHLDGSTLPSGPDGSRFRQAHGLSDKLVIMYSGNLSPVHSVQTVLDAARSLYEDQQFSFVFVGAGLGRAEIERCVTQFGLRNVKTLPYQPLSELHEALAAADVHLVSMGPSMVGIVHPCKIYGAMAVGRPILALGPRGSHVAEIVTKHDVGWHVEHGDTARMLEVLRALRHMPRRELEALGQRASRIVQESFSRVRLLRAFCDVLEGTPIATDGSSCADRALETNA